MKTPVFSRPACAISAFLAAAAALAVPTTARNLVPSDPYDARILAAYNCNKAVVGGDYSETTIARCRAEYDKTVAFARTAQSPTPAQRNTLAIAKGLSMMTVAAGYAKIDGVMSARACQAIKGIDSALAGYVPAAPNGLEGLQTLLVNTRDEAIPKCRIGGYWPG